MNAVSKCAYRNSFVKLLLHTQAQVFIEVFGKQVCRQIEAVAMDCWAAYEGAVNEHLPDADIVWDMFHIIKNYNKDVIDRVRRQEAYAKLGGEAASLKNTRFLSHRLLKL